MVNKDNGYETGYRIVVSDATGKVYWQTGDYNTEDVLSTSGIQKEVWYHVVGTYDGQNKYLYINGVLNNSGAKTTSIYYASDPLEIGRGDSTGGFTYYFNGTIDEVKIYNRNLSAEQILALYNNRTDLIVSPETSVGDNWSVCVTPNDGIEDGTEVCSENLTIVAPANNVPNTISVILNSTSVNNYTADDLTCYANITDADGGTVYANYTWYKDGVENLTGQSAAFTQGTLSNIANLSYVNTTAGENWTCSVMAYDGTDYESDWNNATIYISSSQCGLLTSDTTLINDVSSVGTCFTIGANDIFLDCAYHNINYSSGSDIGWGVNNTGFDNILIQNCNFYEQNSSTNESHAVYFTTSNNSTIYNNNFTMIGKHSYAINFNNSPNATISNNKITTSNQYAHGIFFNRSSDNNFIGNTIVSSTYTGYAMYLIDTSLSNLTSNIITTSGSASNRGVVLDGISSYNNISQNNITTTAYGGWAIKLSIDSNFTTIGDNIINTDGYNGHALYVQSSLNNINDNLIDVDGDSADGVWILSGSNQNITGNNISIAGDNRGILFSNDVDDCLIENNIVASNSGRAVGLGNGCSGNLFYNNNLSSTNSDYVFWDGSGNSAFNTIIYNNSFGMVNWTLLDLDFNITLEIGTNIYLQNNLVGLTDDNQRYNLNNSAEIEIRTLNYNVTPRLLKDGVRCDNSDACNISYNNVTGVLFANVSSFSNYTTSASNNEPNVTQLVILPTTAYTNTALTANTTYTDSDLDSGTLYFLWYVNGTNVLNQTNSSISNGSAVITTLASTYFNKTHTVNVSVYANDGTDDSNTLWSSIVTILNAPPETQNVTLTSSDLLNRTNGTLIAIFSFSDLDGDSNTLNETKWYNNSVEVVALANFTLIGSGNTSKDENWTFGVRAYDGTDWSVWVNSSNLTIINTPPTFNESLITQNVVAGNQFTYDINCSDLDNDVITYYDNTSLFDINSSTGLINYTALVSQMGNYEINITCGDNQENISEVFTYIITDGTSPNVTLVSPAISYSSSASALTNINFSCNVTDDYQLQNISLYLTNSTNQLFALNNTSVVAGTTNSSSWNLSLGVGNYTWNCLTYDTAGNSDWGDVNWTVILNYTVPIPTPVPTPAPSPGGGGGGVSKKECNDNQDNDGDGLIDLDDLGCESIFDNDEIDCYTNADCSVDLYCVNHQCLKIFDLKILQIDSPIQPGQFFDFTYFVKAMADIEGDVTLNFWLEKGGRKVTSGRDVIFVGSFEEKIESANMFLPSDAELGIYKFVIQLAYEDYQIDSARVVEVSYDVPLIIGLVISDLPVVIPNRPWEYNAVLSFNKDGEYPVNLQRKITTFGTEAWVKESNLIVNNSEIITDSVIGLPPGEYLLELFATNDDNTAVAKESFVVGKSSLVGGAFMTFVKENWWALLLLVLLVIVILLILWWIKNRQNKETYPLSILENWVERMFASGKTKEEIIKVVLDTKWTDEELNLVFRRVDVKLRLRKVYGLTENDLNQLNKFIFKQVANSADKEETENLLISVGWPEKAVKEYLAAYL